MSPNAFDISVTGKLKIGKMLAKYAFEKLLKDYTFDTVLDVGAGQGQHTEAFLSAGKKVTAVDLGKSHYFHQGKWASHPNLKFVQAEFLSADLGVFDCIWASHVLEHQRNPGQFLDRCFALLRDNGILAVSVPPLKHEIVGGHLTLWNPGLVVYNLVLARFNCRRAAVRAEGYNISVIVRKDPVPDEALDALVYDWGDIRRLAPYFPLDVVDGFTGQLQKPLNW